MLQCTAVRYVSFPSAGFTPPPERSPVAYIPIDSPALPVSTGIITSSTKTEQYNSMSKYNLRPGKIGLLANVCEKIVKVEHDEGSV
jgi:hypothetical protein